MAATRKFGLAGPNVALTSADVALWGQARRSLSNAH